MAFIFTTFTGVTGGIFASVGLSLLVILKRASRPSSAVLGLLPGTDVYVPLKVYPQAVEEPGIKIFRFHGDLTFANKEHLETKLAKMFRQNVSRAPIHTLVIDCSAIHTIDSSAAEALKVCSI